jgi:allantoate deiminase
MSPHEIRQLAEAIQTRLEALAAISDQPDGLTRLYLSPAHRRAVVLVEGWMREAGMTTRLDPLGTLIGAFPGADPDAMDLLIGSHIDSVRDAGIYDGPLGVISAIEIVAKLHREGRHLPFGIQVLAFGDEEGVRFPSALSSSRAVAGHFDPTLLDERDEDGVSRREAMEVFGCPSGDPTAGWNLDRAIAYLEIHIEQGPVLEAENRPLGVVTAISGATRGFARVRGQSGHAGTVPMALRADALAAASEMILAVERIARTTDGLVGTVGRLTMANPAINVVPGQVEFTLDIRSTDDTVRAEAARRMVADIRAIAAARHVEVDVAFNYDAPAAHCAPALRRRLSETIEQLTERPVRQLASGAGHDAMSFRDRLPMAMLFVRSKAGISHNPLEFSSAEDIGLAAATLHDTILRLATDNDPKGALASEI